MNKLTTREMRAKAMELSNLARREQTDIQKFAIQGRDDLRIMSLFPKQNEEKKFK